MKSALVFFNNSFCWVFSIQPSIFWFETFLKIVLFSFFQFNSFFGNRDFSLNISLLNDGCDNIVCNMLIFDSGIDLIETIWYGLVEISFSWHFENMLLSFEFCYFFIKYFLRLRCIFDRNVILWRGLLIVLFSSKSHHSRSKVNVCCLIFFRLIFLNG